MKGQCNKQSCSSCAEDYADKQTTDQPHALSNIKKVIGIVSGKGGVGKSLLTSLLASEVARKGPQCAILDADITGPSIPKVFGITGMAVSNGQGIVPLKSATGIAVMSFNLLLQDVTQPVLWRGPIIGNMVRQFWAEVIWEDIDFMFVDMPPGTGDVPLTVFQSLPVDGIIVVTSPQELVAMIVSKAVNMAKTMHVPILGLVENMSYFHCPDNGKDYKIFGESHIDQVGREYGIPVLAKLPLDPKLAEACDAGKIEHFNAEMLTPAVDLLLTMDTTRQ